LPKYVKTSLIPVSFVLAIMEIEAWFLAEATHYQKIDAAITWRAVKAALGFDPGNDDMEQRPAPRTTLASATKIGGKAYVKHRAPEHGGRAGLRGDLHAVPREVRYVGSL